MRISAVSPNNLYRSKINFGKFKDEKAKQKTEELLIQNYNKKDEYDMLRFSCMLSYLEDASFAEMSVGSNGKLRADVDTEYIKSKLGGVDDEDAGPGEFDTAKQLLDFAKNTASLVRVIDKKDHPEEYVEKPSSHDDDVLRGEALNRARAEYLAYW